MDSQSTELCNSLHFPGPWGLPSWLPNACTLKSAFPLAAGSVITVFESHAFSQRSLATQFALQDPAYFCWTRRASHMTSFTCLEIAQSKDFSAILSLHLFQILQILLCSHAQNFSRWSSKGKNMLWCSIPLSYIPHLSLKTFFTRHLLLSIHTNIYMYFFSFEVVIHTTTISYFFLTSKTKSAGNIILHLQTNDEVFIINPFFFLKPQKMF